MVVRSDTNMGNEFADSEVWDADISELYNFIEEVEIAGETKRIVSSQSGNERNHIFINQPDSHFADKSLISGVDSLADGRANAFWDFDHDGWQDIVLINANNPYLQIFRNQLSESNPDNHFVALRLHGGNQTDKSSSEWSNRDGIGAIVRVTTEEHTHTRELRAGEGFAGQNSKTLIIGIGTAKNASLSIKWPSGKSKDFGEISVGQLVHCYEDVRQTFADLSGIETADYESANFKTTKKINPNPVVFQIPESESTPNVKSQLNIYVSMATWCEACQTSQPQVKMLMEHFGETVSVFGVPIDVNDTKEKLRALRRETHSGLSSPDRNVRKYDEENGDDRHSDVRAGCVAKYRDHR